MPEPFLFKDNIQLEKLDLFFNQNLVLNSPMAIFTSTSEGRFLTANPAMARMFGYETPEELVESITDLAEHIYADPVDREEFKSQLELHGEVEDFECLMLRRDGTRFWCSLNALLVRNNAREVLYYQGFMKDITKRKLSEQALIESEQRWRSVLQNTPQIGISLDTRGKIIFANKYFLNLTGWKEEQVLEQSWFDMFIPADIREQIREVFNSLMSSKHDNRFSTYENAILTRDGDFRIITWSNVLNLDKEGYATDVTSLGVDITESRQLKESLRKSEEKYRTLMEQSLDMIFVHDLEGNFLEVNRAAIKRTGYSREELLGMGVFDLQPDQSGREEILEMIRKWRPGDSTILELTHVDKHGRKYPVEINTGKVHFGNRDYILATVRDISQRKQAQEDLKKSRLRFEYLLQSSARRNSFQKIIGRSRQMQHVYAMIHQVAGVDTTVLITGETGTGKELVAEALHASSQRSNGPLIKVNCLTLSDELLDSELFGHVKGAFTGAYTDKIGRVEAAEGGTIFLDEIGDLTERIQLKLLRFLQEKEYERVGESKTHKADVRIVAATNADLASRVEQGHFRKDLYYRLKVITISVPLLRERTEDIPLLIEHFCKHFAEKFGKTIKGVKPEVMKLMLKYTWPGNVRELEHVLEHGMLLCPEGLIDMEHLPEELLDQEQTDPQLQLEAASVNREDPDQGSGGD